MLKNYFILAWRNMLRNKTYSIINITGLALGITSCFLIYSVVQYQLTYDKFNSKIDRIYRVTMNGLDFNANVSMAVAPAMRNSFPELEKVSQVWFQENGLIGIGPEKYQEKIYAYADEHFSSVFDYAWLHGDKNKALAEPNTVVLTESIANKYFGSKQAIGQIINLENQYNLKVTGVIKDLPGNTHLPFNLLVSFKTIQKDLEQQGAMSIFYWIRGGSFTYMVTPERFDISRLQNRMPSFIKKTWGNDIAKDTRLLLQPVSEIPFDTRYINNINTPLSKNTFYALIAIAALIIIIACVNFINLSTAQAIKRAKEVGVRKVLGSTRWALIKRFLAETSLQVFIALILAMLSTYIAIPALAQALNLKISFNQFLQPSFIGLTLLFALGTILLAGLYPAMIQSSFKPVQALKSKASFTGSRLTLRKSLVVLQFAISQCMIIGTLVIAYQMDFLKNKDLGFEKNAMISLSIPDQQKAEILKQELIKIPGVQHVSLSSGAPAYANNFTNFNSPEAGITKDDVTEVKLVDGNYMDMFRLTMLAGEKVNISNASANDSLFNVVVNETLIHKIGIQDAGQAIGRHIFFNGKQQGTIIGVVKDFQSGSRHTKIAPCILFYAPDFFTSVSVKIGTGDIQKTTQAIDQTWSTLFPSNLFSYEFLDTYVARFYVQEQKEYTVFKLFSTIAIIIGCLSLYGLIAFAAAQRTKEVGIRKVMGASKYHIVALFSKEFVWLIVIAFLIASPIAWYAMNNWLQSFAYRVNIHAGIFIIAILASFTIAATTIAYQSIKAAVANPVKSLRTE